MYPEGYEVSLFHCIREYPGRSKTACMVVNDFTKKDVIRIKRWNDEVHTGRGGYKTHGE